MKRSEIVKAQARAAEMLKACNIEITEQERTSIEVACFGLNELEIQGLELITYVNTDRYCAKELLLFPLQTCPEHLHPPIGTDPGKMETFRCRSGKVFLYVEGEATKSIQGIIPVGSEPYYTVFNEIELNPGEQYTIHPGIKHWFQAGADGAVVSEFSSTSRDEFDIFTDTRIERMPTVTED
ncbi:D-lyxose/D-mannose family sugar isomerase [Paenibacillus psychroresistens]|uniref:D-lyxose ketol-isomerase n=2 Tax=Paenibacillus psychroresistens TaxID=1778678 RepID=A0A6B8RGR6_9BACL|nr:D-lyxose/D-mannose family sugar isomerase [Paenibacillus psychroresistens]